MRVPRFLTVLEGNISLVGLHVVVVAELLERHLLPVRVQVAHTGEQFTVERTVPVLKSIASEHVSPEVHRHFLQQAVGRGQIAVAGIVGLHLSGLAAFKRHDGMGLLSCISGTHLFQVERLGFQAAADILIGCLIHIFHEVAVRFLHPAQFPLGNHLTGIAGNICERAFQNGTFTAIGVFHTLLVGDFPVIVCRAAALADDTAEVSSLTGIELPVCLAGYLVSTVGHTHLSLVVHGREHGTGEQVGFRLAGHVIARHAPSGVQRNGRYGKTPSFTEPAAAALAAVLDAE